MKKHCFLFFWFCCQYTSTVWAQWNDKDSLWLKDALSGKEQIRLNPEAMKAIESGTLISTDILSPKEQMMGSPTKIPITKDFTQYVKPQNLQVEKAPDPYSMPPAVYMRYGLKSPLPQVYKSTMVHENTKKAGTKPSGMSFNDALTRAFSPGERAKERNKRKAQAWKMYNGM